MCLRRVGVWQYETSFDYYRVARLPPTVTVSIHTARRDVINSSLFICRTQQSHPAGTKQRMCHFAKTLGPSPKLAGRLDWKGENRDFEGGVNWAGNGHQSYLYWYFIKNSSNKRTRKYDNWQYNDTL